MDAKLFNAELRAALKTGLVCGISAAVIELYYLVLALADSGISQPIYQTLWLLTTFLFALAGVGTVRLVSKSIKSLSGAALYSGLSGVVAGILYAAAVIIVGLVGLVFDVRYFNLSSFLTSVLSIVFSSLLWLPAVVAVAVLGGMAYAILVQKAE